MNKTVLTDLAFSDLNLTPDLLRGIDAAGYHFCTPIQKAALPLALDGKDIVGRGQTGTGKTATYLIAAMNRLLLSEPLDAAKKQPKILIIAPTRELAIQIARDAELLGRYTGLIHGLAYGGVDYEKQRKHLSSGCDLLIATPGRLIDFFKKQVFSLNFINTIIIDEADRMFDLGFIKDIRFLLRRIPKPEKRLGLLFSATLSHRVRELAYEHLNNPIDVDTDTTNSPTKHVRQTVYFPADDEKISLLLGLLAESNSQRSLVFCNTKHATEKVMDYLSSNGFKPAMLSGSVPQKKRQRYLQDFHDGKLNILVATDVAARGLHIPDVSHVFNYDLPQDAEDYVHRIGRTARMGASGEAVSFACERSAVNLPDIEQFIGEKINVATVSDVTMTTPIKPTKTHRPSPPKSHSKRPARQQKNRRTQLKKTSTND